MKVGPLPTYKPTAWVRPLPAQMPALPYAKALPSLKLQLPPVAWKNLLAGISHRPENHIYAASRKEPTIKPAAPETTCTEEINNPWEEDTTPGTKNPLETDTDPGHPASPNPPPKKTFNPAALISDLEPTETGQPLEAPLIPGLAPVPALPGPATELDFTAGRVTKPDEPSPWDGPGTETRMYQKTPGLVPIDPTKPAEAKNGTAWQTTRGVPPHRTPSPAKSAEVLIETPHPVAPSNSMYDITTGRGRPTIAVEDITEDGPPPDRTLVVRLRKPTSIPTPTPSDTDELVRPVMSTSSPDTLRPDTPLSTAPRSRSNTPPSPTRYQDPTWLRIRWEEFLAWLRRL